MCASLHSCKALADPYAGDGHVSGGDDGRWWDEGSVAGPEVSGLIKLSWTAHCWLTSVAGTHPCKAEAAVDWHQPVDDGQWWHEGSVSGFYVGAVDAFVACHA